MFGWHAQGMMVCWWIDKLLPVKIVSGCILACTYMTKSNKIRILQVVLVVGLSWASNGINFGLKNLHLAVRALP